MPEPLVKLSIARRILWVFAYHGGLPGVTLGDVETIGGLARGTATHQRITDLRRYGWDIGKPERDHDGHYTYHVRIREQERMKKHLSALSQAGCRTATIREKKIA